EHLDLVSQVLDGSQELAHPLEVSLYVENLLPDDGRERSGHVTVARLEGCRICPLSDEVGFAQLLTSHLKEHQSLTFRCDGLRVLFTKVPGLEIGVRLAGVTSSPIVRVAHWALPALSLALRRGLGMRSPIFQPLGSFSSSF